MRVEGILRRLISRCQRIHQKRRRTFLVLLCALIRGRRLSVTGLGRAVSGRTSAKHSIKRAMRFVGNNRLHQDAEHVFAMLANEVISDVKQPVILIDWTPLKNDFYCLSAAVPVGGRALVGYEEVHTKKNQNKSRIHNAFLKGLQRIVPEHCVPIIVVDAGFRTPFFKRVRSMGWDFVGRLSNNVLVRTGRTEWIKATSLYSKATTTARELGDWFVAKTAKSQARYRLVRVRKRRGRKRKTRAPISSAQAKARKRNIDPWLLVTSLTQFTATQIVGLYATRMQIEETFRDKKNHRFGWSLNAARSRNAEHWRVLLLIAAVAMFALIMLGIQAERQNLHRGYQANTVTSRRVLSHVYLAIQLLARNDPRLGPIQWKDARLQCREYLQSLTTLKREL